MCIFSVILGELEPSRNYKGLQYYFPENFTDSFLQHIFESENVRFPFFYEKYNNLRSEMWKIKL